MKIAIPVDKKEEGTGVYRSFGRAPYFLIYDTEMNKGTFLENSAKSSTGGAGIKAAQTIMDNDVEALLTPRCGEKAAEVLKLADIKIYKTNSGSAKENIDDFMADNLSILDEIHAGFHGHEGN